MVLIPFEVQLDAPLKVRALNANQRRKNNERSQPKHRVHWTPVQPQAEHHQTNSRKDTECIETGDTPIEEQCDNTQIFGCSGRNPHGSHEKQCELTRTATTIDEMCSSGESPGVALLIVRPRKAAIASGLRSTPSTLTPRIQER